MAQWVVVLPGMLVLHIPVLVQAQAAVLPIPESESGQAAEDGHNDGIPATPRGEVLASGSAWPQETHGYQAGSRSLSAFRCPFLSLCLSYQ